MVRDVLCTFFFSKDTATTEIYTLSLHERSSDLAGMTAQFAQTPNMTPEQQQMAMRFAPIGLVVGPIFYGLFLVLGAGLDRKSTSLNSSHCYISYAAFCLTNKCLPSHRRPRRKPG